MPAPLPFASLQMLLDAPLPVARARLRRWIEDWIAKERERCSDRAFAAAFDALHQHYDAPPEAYLQRELSTPFGRVLGGIRFFGLNPDLPFIELLAWDSLQPETLLPLLQQEWAEFKPQRVRLLLPTAQQPSGGRLDMSVPVARCAEMVAAAPAGTLPAVVLEPVTDSDAALSLVAAVHADVNARQPELGARLQSMDAAALAWCQAEGKARTIKVDDRVAGLIACAPDAIAFLKGQVIVEEVVHPAFQGRGLAAAAQRALAAELSRDDADALMIGTIAHDNHASNRSASRAGRPALLNYWFLSLPAGSGQREHLRPCTIKSGRDR